MKITLNRDDLNENHKNDDIRLIKSSHFNGRDIAFTYASLVEFVDDDGSRKVLKNRLGSLSITGSNGLPIDD